MVTRQHTLGSMLRSTVVDQRAATVYDYGPGLMNLLPEYVQDMSHIFQNPRKFFELLRESKSNALDDNYSYVKRLDQRKLIRSQFESAKKEHGTMPESVAIVLAIITAPIWMPAKIPDYIDEQLVIRMRERIHRWDRESGNY